MGTDFPVVLVDDGELDDVRDLLLDLGVEFAHLRGGAVPKKLAPPRDLFVATIRHAQLASSWAMSEDGSQRPVRIAVTAEDSNTARSLLRRMGFSFLVRRPVHPVALRLLLLRSLYRGEERRAETRVPVGLDVSLRSGLRRRDALLADLSRGGCRLLTDKALAAGSKVAVHLGREVAGGESFSLSGRVVRCERDASALFEGGYSVAVQFAELSVRDARRLERTLASRSWVLEGEAAAAEPVELAPSERARKVGREKAAGPPAPGPVPVAKTASAASGKAPPEAAPPPAAPAESFDPNELTQPASATARPGQAAREPAHPAPAPPAAGRAEPPPAGRLGAALLSRSKRRAPPPERRRHARGHYGRKVIAAASEAMHRMLLGRDLAVGGMRVDRHPDLQIGSRLRIALYDPGRETPLVLDAVVARDDGRRGLALHFEGVDAALAERLEEIVASLPPVECLLDGEPGAMGTVLSEIVS
jgi:hypothetical protein